MVEIKNNLLPFTFRVVPVPICYDKWECKCNITEEVSHFADLSKLCKTNEQPITVLYF